MADQNFPVHMYKDLHAPLYANDKGEVEAFEASGWTSERRNIGPQNYPAHLYREDGDAVIVGNYQNGQATFQSGQKTFTKGILLIDYKAAQAEEARYKEQGYGRDAVAKDSAPEAPVKGIMEAIVDVKANAERLTALEGDVADIKSGMAEILAALRPAAKRSKSVEHQEI